MIGRGPGGVAYVTPEPFFHTHCAERRGSAGGGGERLRVHTSENMCFNYYRADGSDGCGPCGSSSAVV